MSIVCCIDGVLCSQIVIKMASESLKRAYKMDEKALDFILISINFIKLLHGLNVILVVQHHWHPDILFMVDKIKGLQGQLLLFLDFDSKCLNISKLTNGEIV